MQFQILNLEPIDAFRSLLFVFVFLLKNISRAGVVGVGLKVNLGGYTCNSQSPGHQKEKPTYI